MTTTSRPPRARIRHVRYSELEPDVANRRIDALLPVVAESMTPGVGPDASWAGKDFDSRRPVLIDTAEAYEATVEGRIVGFVAFRIEELRGRPTIHLMAGCISPSHQASGLASTMTARIVVRALVSRPGTSVYVAGHVVNPVALAGWVKRVGSPDLLYPSFDGAPHPNTELGAAAATFAGRNSAGLEFDPLTGVIAGKHLPGDRVPTPPSGIAEVDDLYARHVSQANGDTVLMVIDGNVAMVSRHLRQLCSALTARAMRRMRVTR